MAVTAGMTGQQAQSSDEQNQRQQLVDYFGEETVEQLASQKWQSRKDGLANITSMLNDFRESKKEVKTNILGMYTQVLNKLLVDSVLQVFLMSVELGKTLFGSFARELPSRVVQPLAYEVMPLVLQRTGDSNQRICSTATEFLMSLAESQNVGIAVVAEGALQPITNMNQFKLLINRLQIIQNLIVQHGFRDDCALNLPGVMVWVGNILNNCINKKVQQTGAAVVVEAYRRKGKEVEPLLADLKPTILKMLRTEIESEITDAAIFQNADEKEKEIEDVDLLEALKEDDQKRIQPLIDTFGPGISCLISKQWKLRLSAVERLQQQLDRGAFFENATPSGKQEAFVSSAPRVDRATAKKMFAQCTHVLTIGLSDSVPSVYTASCGLLCSAVKVFGSLVSENDFKLCMERIIVFLIQKSGDLNSAVKKTTTDTLTVLAEHEKIGVGFVATYVMQPFKSLSQWRPIVGRLELLSQLVNVFSFTPGGLSIEAAMAFTVSTFESPSGKVRSAAVEVILEVYKKAGNVVRTYIQNQKPALVNELKTKIMKIARKDRTKSAPIQRLANIVQPLAEEGGEDEFGSGRPQTFPTTLEDPIQEEDTMSIRQKWQRWHRQKQEEAGVPVEDTPEEKREKELAQILKGRAEKVTEKKPTRRGNLVFS